MNIFYLSHDQRQCAMWHNDRHCIKMMVEYAQLLSTAHRVLDGEVLPDKIFRKTIILLPHEYTSVDFKERKVEIQNKQCCTQSHINHPSSKWVRTSTENYKWLFGLWSELLDEWRRRYGHNKVHKLEEYKQFLSNPPKNLVVGDFTPMALAMPDEHKISDDATLCYRQYYKLSKAHLAKWKNSDVPPWFN